ncbi:MAG: serine/threonine protein kinase, partial [Chloroflexi bacterium]
FYRSHQNGRSRIVAVKVLPISLAAEADFVQRFHQEAETAASLEHPHIIPVYDYGVQYETSFIVMRLLTGGTLADRVYRRDVKQQALPSLSDIATLLNQLAGAFDYAHSRGVIHRDIKPNNIMFDHQGNAFLVDFGIAKLLASTSSLTATGSMLGTPLYMDPEQWRAEQPTPATDQYALGVTIYQLLTGRVPFEAPTPYGLMHKHLNESPTAPNVFRPDLPDAPTLVLERALAKSPNDRFPTVVAFAQAFERSIAGAAEGKTDFFTVPLTPKRPAPPVSVIPTPHSSVVNEPTYLGKADVSPPAQQPFYRRRSAWSGALVLLIAVLAAGAWFLFGGTGGDKDKEAAGVVLGTPGPEEVTPTASVTGVAIVILPSDTPPGDWTDVPPPSNTPPDTAAAIERETPDVTPQEIREAALENTLEPTSEATRTPAPTGELTSSPTDEPTSAPSETPAQIVILADTAEPTGTDTPTDEPTSMATDTPEPTNPPTATPTDTPTDEPTSTATDTPEPTSPPTATPTDTPTD